MLEREGICAACQRTCAACDIRPSCAVCGILHCIAVALTRRQASNSKGKRLRRIAHITGDGLGDCEVRSAGPVHLAIAAVGYAVQIKRSSTQGVFGVAVCACIAEYVQAGICSSLHDCELLALFVVRVVRSPDPDGACRSCQIPGYIEGCGIRTAVARYIDVLLCAASTIVACITAIFWFGAKRGICLDVVAEHRRAGDVHGSAFRQIHARAVAGGGGVLQGCARADRQAAAGGNVDDAAVGGGGMMVAVAVQRDVPQRQAAVADRDHALVVKGAGDLRCGIAAYIGEAVVGIPVSRGQQSGSAVHQTCHVLQLALGHQHLDLIADRIAFVIVPLVTQAEPMVVIARVHLVERRDQRRIHSGYIGGAVAVIGVQQTPLLIGQLADRVQVGEGHKVIEMGLRLHFTAHCSKGAYRPIPVFHAGVEVCKLLDIEQLLDRVAEAQRKQVGAFRLAVGQRKVSDAACKGHIPVNTVDFARGCLRSVRVWDFTAQRQLEAVGRHIGGIVAQHLLFDGQGIDDAPVDLIVVSFRIIQSAALHAVAVVEEVVKSPFVAVRKGGEGVHFRAVLVVERR